MFLVALPTMSFSRLSVAVVGVGLSWLSLRPRFRSRCWQSGRSCSRSVAPKPHHGSCTPQSMLSHSGRFGAPIGSRAMPQSSSAGDRTGPVDVQHVRKPPARASEHVSCAEPEDIMTILFEVDATVVVFVAASAGRLPLSCFRCVCVCVCRGRSPCP